LLDWDASKKQSGGSPSFPASQLQLSGNLINPRAKARIHRRICGPIPQSDIASHDSGLRQGHIQFNVFVRNYDLIGLALPL